jgi:alanyl-tRNA synthetase
VDEAGFEQAMTAQRERSRSASSFDLDYNSLIKVDADTRFPVTKA